MLFKPSLQKPQHIWLKYLKWVIQIKEQKFRTNIHFEILNLRLGDGFLMPPHNCWQFLSCSCQLVWIFLFHKIWLLQFFTGDGCLQKNSDCSSEKEISNKERKRCSLKSFKRKRSSNKIIRIVNKIFAWFLFAIFVNMFYR